MTQSFKNQKASILEPEAFCPRKKKELFMKFKKDNFLPPLPDGTIEKTLQYEGGAKVRAHINAQAY